MMSRTAISWAANLAAVLLLFCAGCATLSQPQQTRPPVEASAAPATPATSASSATLVPSPTPTLRPSPTARPTQTPTITPYPTLEPEEKRTFVLEMLSSNGGCELPCWWGIVPGETGWEEMRAFFAAQGIGVSENGYLDLGYPDPEVGYRVPMLEVELEQQGGLVQAIRVTNDRTHEPLADDPALVWRRYELAQILSQYGVPSQVYLSLAVGAACIGPGVVPTYDMWVVYEDLGMAVLYPGMLIRDLDNWLLCPVFGQTSDVFGPTRTIEIRLQSPALDRPVVSMEPGDGVFNITGTLMELAQMSVEEFYEIFGPIPHGCALISDPEPSYSTYDELVQSPDSSRMTDEEEDAFLVDMLAGKDGCELPCWWGITPGVTSWQDAQQMFLSYGRRIGVRQHHAGYRKEDGDYIESYAGVAHDVSPFGRHAQYPFDYVVEHTFYEQGDTVQLLEVIGHALGGDTWYNSSWSAPQVFLQDWHRYTLDQILSRLGSPSQVLLHYWPQEGTLYSLAVMYEDQGIMMATMGPVHGKEKDEDGYELDPVFICPTSDQVSDINIWLKSPELEESLTGIYNDWRLGAGYYTLPFSESRSPSLEEATGMSLEVFYTTYLDPNTQVCLEASAELADQFP
jgi:hypothetical protein